MNGQANHDPSTNPSTRVPLAGRWRRFIRAAGRATPHTHALILLAVLAGASGAAALWRTQSSLLAGAEGTQRPTAGEGLLSASFPPLCQRIYVADSAEAHLVERLMKSPPAGGPTAPGLAHMLRLYGTGPIGGGLFATGQEVLDVLTDADVAQQTLGQSLLFRTREGVRYRLHPRFGPADGESHRDLFLACFAELGVPTTHPLRMADDTADVQAALADSLATFALSDQRELPWTAVAYAVYVSAPWRNRDDDLFTFDDLAAELLARPLDRQPCGGVHSCYALTLLLRRDDSDRIFSPECRTRVRERIVQWREGAIAAQSADGSWSVHWADGRPPPKFADTAELRLIVTGHVLEWAEYLPVDLQFPRSTIHAAAQWLVRELARRADAKEPAPICPWTHAVCALRNLIAKPTPPRM